jgi:hypothetical protein
MPEPLAEHAPENPHDTLPPSLDATPGTVVDPPRDFFGIVKRLGPGLIIAGSIVGSGELIATTKTGAQAGISLLWLIIIGCLIKVFVQIELGRFAISHGETTLAALDRVPGPRLRVGWIVWYWLLMALVGLGQLGGIVGGVGQALAIAFPVTGDYKRAIEVPSANELKRHIGWTEDIEKGGAEFSKLQPADQEHLRLGLAKMRERLARLNEGPQPGSGALAAVQRLVTAERFADGLKKAGADGPTLDAAQSAVATEKVAVSKLLDPVTWDDRYWAMGVTFFTIALIFRGRYGVIQNTATALVVAFTFVTIGNVVALEFNPTFRLLPEEILSGLMFRFPESLPPPPDIVGWAVKRPLATALATFGIIGVGAAELVAYPYWCLEKGYAKFTGPRSDDPEWVRRGRGWMMVMHYDAFASMVIYTVATLAFFLMGVAVMYKQGLDPEGMRMVGTLLEQYVPVFGLHAKWLFLFGAFAVLYSTFLVANAGYTRLYTDALKVFGLLDRQNQKTHDRSVSFFAVALPMLSLCIFWTGADPVKLVLLGGTMQAVMLPMLGYAALYFRFRLTDPRLKPGRLWDGLLIVSCVGLAIAGGWGAYSHFFG